MEKIDPKPNEVQKYLNKWKELENYVLQEESLNKLFSEHYSENKDIHEILIKASTLNDFYSTNIFSIFHVAKNIHNLKIDSRLKSGDLSLIDDISEVEINGKDKVFYSFATKYCSHHFPEKFPIYDSFVDKVLWELNKRDSFSIFKRKDLKSYKQFNRILFEFRDFYGLNEFKIKEIDKYLWLVGKEYFPKY
jgi:hypothetical protein